MGKALGGASGGYTAGPQEIVNLLRQKARPYLFSNTLAPPVVGAALSAIDLLETYVEKEVVHLLIIRILESLTRSSVKFNERRSSSDLKW